MFFSRRRIYDLYHEKLKSKNQNLYGGNTRNWLAKVMNIMVDKRYKSIGIDDCAHISKSAKIGDNVFIGPGTYVGGNVKIGNNTKIYPNVTIHDDTIIGESCLIQSGVVIGGEGYGFYEENDSVKQFPHVGKVIIGDYVSISSNVVIDRGSLSDTRIGKNTKLANLVNIGHGVIVGEKCLIMTGASISGGSVVGNNVQIHMYVAVAGHLSIGDNAIIGMHSTVLKNVLENTTVYGTPAKERK